MSEQDDVMTRLEEIYERLKKPAGTNLLEELWKFYNAHPVIRDRIAALAADNARLRKVEAVLPKTADGVTIVPGMRIFPLQPLPKEELDDEEDYAVAEITARDAWAGDVIDAEDLPKNYSSAEAARTALAGGEVKHD